MEKIRPEKVVEILRGEGVHVTLEQAALILSFMRKLAEIAVSQYLKDNRL